MYTGTHGHVYACMDRVLMRTHVRVHAYVRMYMYVCICIVTSVQRGCVYSSRVHVFDHAVILSRRREVWHVVAAELEASAGDRH